MNDNQLRNISNKIKESLDSGRGVDEFDLDFFLDILYEVYAGKLAYNQEYEALWHAIQVRFSYSDMPDDPTFSAGALWGIVSAYEKMRDGRGDLESDNAKLRELGVDV